MVSKVFRYKNKWLATCPQINFRVLPAPRKGNSTEVRNRCMSAAGLERRRERDARALASHFVTIWTFCCDVSIAMNYMYRNLINIVNFLSDCICGNTISCWHIKECSLSSDKARENASMFVECIRETLAAAGETDRCSATQATRTFHLTSFYHCHVSVLSVNLIVSIG